MNQTQDKFFRALVRVMLDTREWRDPAEINRIAHAAVVQFSNMTGRLPLTSPIVKACKTIGIPPTSSALHKFLTSQNRRTNNNKLNEV